MKQVLHGIRGNVYDLVLMVYESPLKDRKLNIDLWWLPYLLSYL
jgi:hypothetical protein